MICRRLELLALLVLVHAPACTRAPASADPEISTPVFGHGAAPPRAAPVLPGPRLEEFATPHPLLLAKIDDHRRWAVVCQARDDTNGDGTIRVLSGHHGDLLGDAMMPYLIVAGRPEQKLDSFLAADDSGQHLVVIRDKRLLLLDVSSGSEVDLTALGADARDDGDRFARHRAASFDAAGKQLAYMRWREPASEQSKLMVVVRDLQTGDEIEIDPGPGLLLRATLDSGGHWLSLDVVTSDTDGDGTLRWPSIATTLGPRECRGAVRSYSTGGTSGDRPERLLVPVTGGKPRAVPDLIRPMGTALLRRAASGALLLEHADGHAIEIVPAACRARVLHGDAARRRVLVECAFSHESERPGGSGGTLQLHGDDVHARLDLRFYGEHRHQLETSENKRSDELDWPERRFWTVHDKQRVEVVDLETAQIKSYPQAGRLHYTYGTRALIQEDDTWYIFDLINGSRQALVTSRAFDELLPAYRYLLRHRAPVSAGSFVYEYPYVIDLEEGRALGPHEGFALALSHDGRALFAADSRDVFDVMKGPLRWLELPPAR
jgi:hypothetical protein